MCRTGVLLTSVKIWQCDRKALPLSLGHAMSTMVRALLSHAADKPPRSPSLSDRSATNLPLLFNFSLAYTWDLWPSYFMRFGRLSCACSVHMKSTSIFQKLQSIMAALCLNSVWHVSRVRKRPHSPHSCPDRLRSKTSVRSMHNQGASSYFGPSRQFQSQICSANQCGVQPHLRFIGLSPSNCTAVFCLSSSSHRLSKDPATRHMFMVMSTPMALLP